MRRALYCLNNLDTALTDHYSEVKVTMTFPGQGPRVEKRRKSAEHFSVCKKKCTRLFYIAEIIKFDSVLTSSGLENRKESK